MRTWIAGFKETFLREIRTVLRDKNLVTILLIAPVFYPLFYGSIYLNKAEKDVPVVIIDMDRSAVSEKLIRDLDAHHLIAVKGVTGNEDDAEDLIMKVDVQGTIIIPGDFGKNYKALRGTELKILLNTTAFLPSNDINKGVNETLIAYAQNVRARLFNLKGYSIEQAEEISEPIRDQVKFLFNPAETYGDFLLPGIMVLILQQTLLIGLSESIAKEREAGRLHTLIEAAKGKTSAAVAGKSAFYFILFMSYAFFYITLNFMIFTLNMKGSILLTLLFTSVFLIAMISMSFFIASFFNRKILALQVVALTSYPFFFLTGYAWPENAMPDLVRYAGQLFPGTPFINAWMRITQMGADFSEVRREFGLLVILASVGIVTAYFRFRYMMQSEPGVKA